MNPEQTLIIALEFKVKNNASHNRIIANTAQISPCADLLDPAGCFVSLETIPVYNMVIQACEGDFDGDGDVDGSDLAVFATDFGRTDCPILD